MTNITEVSDEDLKAELQRRKEARAEAEAARVAEEARVKAEEEARKKAGRQDANARIAAKLKEASALVKECEAIAKEFGVDFESPIGAYGMGGNFDGASGEWNSSSSNC